jgi:hypothetical protein
MGIEIGIDKSITKSGCAYDTCHISRARLPDVTDVTITSVKALGYKIM